jgi:orotidine-5'-phosphate decarboxylase
MNSLAKLSQRLDVSNSLVSVGLDSDMRYMPRQFRDDPFPQFAFNRWVIEETHNFVSAFKANTAFYEARGDRGLSELKMTIDYIHERYPDIFTICDAKRADVGSSNLGYVEAIYDWLGFDAVTLHPYLGRHALQPFLDRADKVSIIVCRTSNPGAREIQDIDVGGRPLWQHLAEKVSKEWNTNDNCMLIVGAMDAQEYHAMRALIGEMTIVIPGIGTQGGAMQRIVEAALNSAKRGVLVNSARSVIFADDPSAVAKRLRDDINIYRKT